MGEYYPVLLDLRGKLAVVIGGGEVAERKIASLLRSAAHVKVIAPVVSAGIDRLSSAGSLSISRRRYARGDLEGAFLAIAATDDEEINREVWEEAYDRGVLVNVVDAPQQCNFTLPATVRRGPLLLTVSTGGASPALSRAVRERLEKEFGPEYGTFATWLGEAREQVKSRYPSRREREQIWHRIVESDVLDMLRRGDAVGARARFDDIVARGGGG
ncbi:MAG: precorrin-2 dehydrogenase/sirohydrochlorin ferrochelatase family protein [Chloroflexota bacterium]